MKVFILSSSYIENLILTNIEFLIGSYITDIIMLKENHSETEFTNYNKKAIILCNTVIEAATECDVAIIIKPLAYDSDRFEFLSKKISSMVNKLYFVDLNNYVEEYSFSNMAVFDHNAPSILILSIGQFNQITSLELALGKLFATHGIKYKQHFSYFSSILIAGFGANNILSSKIIDSMLINYYDVELITLSSKTIEECFNDITLLNNLSEINPDYVFLLIEKNYFTDTQDYIHNLQYRLNCKFDCVLYSDYISILWDEVSIPILASNDFCTSLCIEKEKVWDSIMKKIAYPENVIVIRASR